MKYLLSFAVFIMLLFSCASMPDQKQDKSVLNYLKPLYTWQDDGCLFYFCMHIKTYEYYILVAENENSKWILKQILPLGIKYRGTEL